MFARAVVCTDLTPDSDALVGCVGQLGVLGVEEAVLTHVVDIFQDPDGLEASTVAANRTFERQLKMLESCGLRVHVEAPIGHPAFSLEEVRTRYSAGLIVVGSGNDGLFNEPIPGTVSSELIQLSHTPILVSPAPDETGQDGSAMLCARMLHNVLVCTDFSDTATRTFDAALQLASLGARKFTLLHVQEEARLPDGSERVRSEYDRKDTIRLGKMRERLISASASEVSIDLVWGCAVSEISTRVTSGEYSLAMLGARGRARQEAAGYLGDVSDVIVRGTSTPLLLMPSIPSGVALESLHDIGESVRPA